MARCKQLRRTSRVAARKTCKKHALDRALPQTAAPPSIFFASIALTCATLAMLR
jgi:hypothetical protein